MATLNASIPYETCFVRNCWLYQDFENKDLTPVYIFGVKAQINRPLLFHCQLDNGAVWWSLPISAFVHEQDFEMMGETEEERLQNLEVWDCESNDIAVATFAYLQHKRVDIRTPSKQWYEGEYMFTIDGYDADLNALNVGYANHSDSKCFHCIRLSNGNYAAYPNNLCLFHNPNFVKPYDKSNPPKYKPRQRMLFAEHRDKTAGRDERYLYEFEQVAVKE